MDWLDRMNRAMDYIETRLADQISYEALARTACCSAYHFQRMFSFIAGVPLSEYIRRRRLTQAAFELQGGKVRVIDAAVKYGYDSPEAFPRAFKALHGVMPSAAHDKGVALKSYPRMSFHISIKGDVEMNYRIEGKGAFELCGLSAEISVIDGQNFVQIPKFWDSVIESGAIDRFYDDLGLAKDACVHAALYNFREGAFSYMICYHTPEGGAPTGYSTLFVPAFTWAVFSTPEHPQSEITEQIQSVWKRIFPEWFPTSGYEHADGPELEMYFNWGNGNFVSEVWIPVVKK